MRIVHGPLFLLPCAIAWPSLVRRSPAPFGFVFALCMSLLHASPQAITAPLVFETNRGQHAEFTDKKIAYVASWRNYRAGFTRDGVILRSDEQAEPVSITFGRPSDANVLGTEPIPGSVSYFLGNDSQKWRAAIPGYRRLSYRGLYPGIDLIFYQSGPNLEFDFVIAPEADPRRISISVTGATLTLGSDGDLRVGPFRLRSPKIYQTLQDGERKPVRGGFRRLGASTIRFTLNEYDSSRSLVIDPELIYSAYITDSDVIPSAVTTDSQGFVFVTGGGTDIFVQKISPDGSQLMFSTHLGGSGLDWASSIAIGPDGNVYLSGTTDSHDFPVVRATQPVMGTPLPYSNEDAVIVELSSDGSQVLFSTYLGGRNTDYGNGIAVDQNGVIYVTGITESDDFPATIRLWTSQPEYEYNLYVAAIDPRTPRVIYATILAPADGTKISLDSQGNTYIGGQTISTNFPFIGFPSQDCQNDQCSRGFVLKATSDGSQILYAQRLGFAGTDTVQSIVVDGQGNTYAAGLTTSGTFPATSGAYQPRPGGGILFHDADQSPSRERRDGGLRSKTVQALLETPAQALFAGTPDGLFRSDDNAQSWNPTSLTQAVTALAIDPDDPSILYAGTQNSGLFKSVDGGNSWAASTLGLSDSPSIPSIVRVIVAPGSIYAATRSGIAKSVDSGVSWAYVAPSVLRSGTAVYIDRSDPNLQLFATQYFCFPNFLFGGCGSNGGGLYRSTDGGMTLKLVISDTIFDLAVNPNQPQMIFGAGSRGVYVSGDAGATWNLASDKTPSSSYRIAFDPLDSHTLYVLSSPQDGSRPGQVMVSKDLGSTWAPLFSQPVASPANELIVVAADRTRFFVGGSLLSDCYLVKLDPSGQLLAATYFGGGGSDGAMALALDSAGNVYVAGYTGSNDFPLLNPVQGSYTGDTDAFAAEFSSDLSQLLWSTYIGGSGSDVARGLAVDPSGALYVTGTTASTDFPLQTALPAQTLYNGGHGFLIKLSPSSR
jgi:photosystem II stability/assembly factor-like uncharacterized protein